MAVLLQLKRISTSQIRNYLSKIFNRPNTRLSVLSIAHQIKCGDAFDRSDPPALEKRLLRAGLNQ